MMGLLLIVVTFRPPRCSLVTWNLLAPHFAPRSKYRWTKAAVLAWPARQAKILAHLAEMDADLVCLQEVEVALWPELLTRLEDMGYEGHLQQSKRNHPVANAVLVRHAALKLVRTESRSRVLISVLRDAANDLAPPLYLANCHLEAGGAEKNADTRMLQLLSLLRRMELQRAIDTGESVVGWPSPETDATGAALVFAGDFNFDRSSEPYAFLAHGTVTPQSSSSSLLGSKALEKRLCRSRWHALLPLRDAYLDSPPPCGPPLRSTFRNGRLIDYVFTSLGVKILRTMPVSNLASSTKNRQNQPSATHPSDHLPIGALISWPGAPQPPASGSRPVWQQLAIKDVQQQQDVASCNQWVHE